jgi:adenylate kinase
MILKGRKMVNAIIFGAPGSGKGTYASRLQSKLSVNVITMGDIFREIMKEDTELAREVRSYVEKGVLGPDSLTIRVLKQHLAKIKNNKGFLFDGYPRTIEQAKALEAIAKIDFIIQLTVPEWIIIERLSTRRICKECGAVYNIRYLKPKVDMVCDVCRGTLYQRPDDTPEVIKKRIEVYEQQTQPILQYYRKKGVPFIEFKTESLQMPPEAAVEEILKGLEKLKLA